MEAENLNKYFFPTQIQTMVTEIYCLHKSLFDVIQSNTRSQLTN
jgi:hypothetical protein